MHCIKNQWFKNWIEPVDWTVDQQLNWSDPPKKPFKHQTTSWTGELPAQTGLFLANQIVSLFYFLFF